MNSIEVKRGLDFDAASQYVEITIAPNAGACFGVVRAIKLGKRALSKGTKNGSVYSLGPLIHNPIVVKELEADGMKVIHTRNEVEGGTVLLRSHGVIKELEAELRANGTKLVDATCPLVKKPQRIAESLGEKGYFLILVGDADHPEVRGVLSYFGHPEFIVTYHAEDILKIPSEVTRVGIIAQTTIEHSVFQKVVDMAKARYDDVLVYNTICDATSIRQSEVNDLAKGADVMVVVGGKNSSNTTKLVKICKDQGTETHHIEEIKELSADWFEGKHHIGITGGASTPPEYVEEVAAHVAQLISGFVPAEHRT